VGLNKLRGRVREVVSTILARRSRTVALEGGSMEAKITRDIIESFLNCKFKGHLKLAGESGTRSDYEAMTAAARQASREQALAELVARFGEGDGCRGIAASAAMLKRGATLLADACVEDEELSLRFDGLKRADGPSRVGGHHYLPVLYNHGNEVGRQQKVLLAVFGLALARVQGLRPTTGLIIRGSGARLGKVRLDARLYRQAQEVLTELGRFQAGGNPPPLTLNAHCQLCEFRQRCRTQAEKVDDLSLLGGLSAKEIAKLNSKGIYSVAQYSHTFRARKGRKQRSSGPRRHPLSLQALPSGRARSMWRRSRTCRPPSSTPTWMLRGSPTETSTT
jgi:predicted RecB family nuclease